MLPCAKTGGVQFPERDALVGFEALQYELPEGGQPRLDRGAADRIVAAQRVKVFGAETAVGREADQLQIFDELPKQEGVGASLVSVVFCSSPAVDVEPPEPMPVFASHVPARGVA